MLEYAQCLQPDANRPAGSNPAPQRHPQDGNVIRSADVLREQGAFTLNTPQQISRALDRVLPFVQKPARYTGGEYNSIVKEWDDIAYRVALVFPDIYDLGMSNLGLAILYDTVNSRPEPSTSVMRDARNASAQLVTCSRSAFRVRH